jgi:hypothetical protein
VPPFDPFEEWPPVIVWTADGKVRYSPSKVFSETYRMGDERALRLFRPMNRCDRRIRPEYWAYYGVTDEFVPAMKKAMSMANDGEFEPYMQMWRISLELLDLEGTTIHEQQLERWREAARKVEQRWAERQKR